jgi:hypothetical protein
MRSLAIQTGPDGTKLEWPASHRLNRISKNIGGWARRLFGFLYASKPTIFIKMEE